MERGDSKTYWLAFDYLLQPPMAAVTEPVTPGSTVMRTTTYHKLRVISLDLGPGNFFDNDFLFGAGVGLGMFAQIMPTNTYSDGSLYYEQYEHEIGLAGLSHQLQEGFKKATCSCLPR